MINISLFTVLVALTAQTGSNSAPAFSVSCDKPVICVIGQGASTTAFTTSEYQITIYADTAAGSEAEAKTLAEEMRKEVIKTVKGMGGKESDVVLSNISYVPPIETEQFHRVNQDLQINLKNVKNIDKVREKFLLMGKVQIGGVLPINVEKIDFEPAIAEARLTAVKNAGEEAQDLAGAMNVILGEPVYVSEQITYPYRYSNNGGYGDYGGNSADSVVTVRVTVYYLMVYKK